ncbi:anti-phage dCTP deaminase [Sphingomonas asaccharolytica]|uniref:anti-phage dCTP deaminase n=1 Tax=Sphingomonas asaccharolytica TaxID=40681 RepID=UPI001C3FA18F|nr:anti-phage dCTP deaminase [Sphingomonas asaccharolytica]
MRDDVWMATTSTSAVEETQHSALSAKPSREVVLEATANELIVAVVGHVGSGTSEIAEALHNLLEEADLPGGPYEAEVLKARNEIEQWATDVGEALPTSDRNDLETTKSLQDLGDKMRVASNDASAVARALVKRIRSTRAEKIGSELKAGVAIAPDGKRRAYILDAIRNPAEVDLLRHVYQDAFVLIGVVCDEKVRLQRIMEKYKNAGRTDGEDLMKRDAKAASRFGQRVTDAFHLSDFFIDNTPDRTTDSGAANPDWNVNDHLSRLVKIVSHSEIVRPSTEETAMHHAYGAGLRSACLSRQVGAALVDSTGNVVSTGTNEVPRAGGGVYGETFDTDHTDHVDDHRCAYRKLNGSDPFCSSTREQNSLIERFIDEIPELKAADRIRKQKLLLELRSSGVGDLLEFSRAVHAEMDALLSAGREGITTVGCRLFVTTFPCHYCARHIVSAGLDEVQFIEPYPKSRAIDLHADSIQVSVKDWSPPSRAGKRVLFRPFVGVAPRMYRRAFIKDRDLKNSMFGQLQQGEPDWGTPWHLRAVSYSDLEAKLAES